MMNNLVKFHETESDTIYMIQDKMQGLVDVPHDLKDNIKLFMIFKDNTIESLQENERQSLISEMINFSKNINNDSEDGLFVVAFIEDSILTNVNAFTYSEELYKIKSLVNNIYNKLLGEGKVRKENFIKKVELLYSDERYKTFMDWLCLQNHSKFHANNYQELLNKNIVKENNNTLPQDIATTPVQSFNNKNAEKVNISPDKVNNLNIGQPTINTSTFNEQSLNNVTQPNNVIPISEKLSIGSVKQIHNFNNNQFYGDATSSGGGPSNAPNQSSELAKTKTLVKTMPTNHRNAAFINWHTIILILVMSFVIGISFSIYLLK